MGHSDWFTDSHRIHPRLMRCNLRPLLELIGRRSSFSTTVDKLWGLESEALFSINKGLSERGQHRKNIGMEFTQTHTPTHSHTQRHQKIVTSFEHFDLAIPEVKYSWALITWVNNSQAIWTCHLWLKIPGDYFSSLLSYKMFCMCHFLILILKIYISIR